VGKTPAGKTITSKYASFASRKWRHYAGKALRSFLNYLKQNPHGDHVVGVVLMAGMGEWVYDWGEVVYDYSPANVKGFRSWLREEYNNSVAKLRAAWDDKDITFATAKIPEPQRFKDADMGVFYNPAISNRMPDYMEYMGEVTASANLY